MITHNDLKKGDRIKAVGLFGQGPRIATMSDSKKGIIREIECSDANGHYPEIGSCYVDDITHVERDGSWVEVTLSDAHRKQMKKVHESLDALGF